MEWEISDLMIKIMTLIANISLLNVIFNLKMVQAISSLRLIKINQFNKFALNSHLPKEISWLGLIILLMASPSQFLMRTSGALLCNIGTGIQ